MDRQTLRDWAHRFNDEGADGLKNRPGAGRPRLLTDEQMGELSVIVETGPAAGPAGDRGVQKNFPRTLAAHLAGLPKTKRVEIWFQDEARLGQKNGRVRIGGTPDTGS